MGVRGGVAWGETNATAGLPSFLFVRQGTYSCRLWAAVVRREPCRTRSTAKMKYWLSPPDDRRTDRPQTHRRAGRDESRPQHAPRPDGGTADTPDSAEGDQ
jgi:hypothetical protein